MIKQLKLQDRYLANSVKIYHEDLNLSGEVDIIATDSDLVTPVFIECKTFGGANPFAKQELMGKRRKGASPKDGNLLQLGMYLHMKDEAIILPPKWEGIYEPDEVEPLVRSVEYGYLTYVDRNEPVNLSEFKVWIDDGHLVYMHEYAKNQVVYCRVDEITDRISELNEYFQTKTPPPRDFHSQYPKETIDRLARAGALGQSQMQIHAQGGNVLKGDWCCKYHNNDQGEHDYIYCDYGKLCELVDADMFDLDHWAIAKVEATDELTTE
jgi:CRISPR/Cas system-associated exonuclease Cas4 (RecB family)